MKTRSLIIGAIFMLTAFTARGQVYEMYYQGFESGEAQNYTLSPSSAGSVSTTLVASGSQSLKVSPQSTGNVIFLTDTIDFTQISALASSSQVYIALEFDHICNIAPSASGDMVKLAFKRYNQSDDQYTNITSQHYNTTETYSTDFMSTSTFHNNSYNEWRRTTMTNEYWKHERFDLNAALTNVAAADRKIIIKIELKQVLNPGTAGWWVDNLKVRASTNQMVKPRISMYHFPDGGAYPNSRGARVQLDAYTVVPQGICADSVYLFYTTGSDPTETRLTLTAEGTVVDHESNLTWTRFGGRIPFAGYDTVMRFRCVVKDNTSNFNTATYPTADGGWVEYWCTRGVDQLGVQTPGFTGTQNYVYFLFPGVADQVAEWVYDSTLMAEAGYHAGAITDMRFTAGANTNGGTRPAYQLRMKNVPSSYVTPNNFTSGYMHAVIDTTLVLPAMSAGDTFTLHFQDTFFYAGNDLLIQSIYNGTSDPNATSIKMISTTNSKKSLQLYDIDQSYNANPYVGPGDGNPVESILQRPAAVITMHKNKPLIYDLGISRLTFPTYIDPIVTQPAQLTAKMNNYGVSTINGVRVSWTIDDTIFGSYDWSGALAGGDSTTVTIGTINNLPAGFHYIRTWVEDTLTVGSLNVRDHEPYNDTAFTEFIVCAGPLNGVRHIGGATPDYNNIEEFLFSLSRCGIDDSLVVKLAPGCYPPFVMPVVDGLSEQHYIVYESLDPEQPAILYTADGTNPIVDITAIGNMRFRNLLFVRRGGVPQNMVAMGNSSHNCHFEGCRFIDSVDNPAASIRIAAMLNTNFSSNTYVAGCTFEGGLIGLSVQGQAPTISSSNNTVIRNIFRNQYNKAIDVQNQTNLTLDHNEMYDVLTNNSYVLQMLHCYGNTQVTGNRVYTTNGAGGIGLSDIHGTETQHAIVANNMIVCDDASGNHQLTTPLNIIKVEWTDVVYNAVKLTAPSRTNIAAATFGGGLIENSRFVNNIVACMDNRNYALSYMPGGQTSNTVNHNVYYSLSSTLNRLTGTGYQTLGAWQQMVPGDSNSLSLNPVFLNGSTVDLRTFNRAIKGKGTPIEGVTVDIFDTVRSTTAPCPGAFEFSSLLFDFEIEAMPSPVAATCDMPDSVELMLRVRNGGTGTYHNGGSVNVNLTYTINDGAEITIAVPDSIPAEDTITVHTGVMLQLPPNGILDATYNFKVWLSCENDPNKTNDTNSFRVVSRYQSAAPTNVEASSLYLQPATVTVTEGINQWPVYDNPEAPTMPSEVYWYYNADDAEPFQMGNTIVTTPLREDTTFYVKQQRKLPVVRITQVMVKSNNNAVGLTDPTPSWMASATQLAVQLTNLGDDTAFLGGDTLRVVSSTTTYNNKGTLRFPNSAVLAPGQAIVVQWVTGATADATKTLHTGTKITPSSTEKLGFIYRRGTVIDAVALNGVTTATFPSSQNVKWNNQNVPSYVWSGEDVSISSNTTGGIIRTGFSGTAADWELASNTNRLFLDAIDSNWIRYTNNGCPGGIGQVHITISNKPTADIELTARPLASGCGLGVEPLTVDIYNYGDSAVSALQINYTLGGDTISETLTEIVPSHGAAVYTFVQSPNLSFDSDSTVNITVWATQVEGDIETNNDTTWVGTVSLFTLDAPEVDSTLETQYGESSTVTFDFPEGVMPVWYDYDMNPVDTGFVYETEVLYTEGSIGVSYIAASDTIVQIGTGTTLSGKTAYPSPYQPNNKFVKQQFLYTAAELQAQGLNYGFINRIAFHLDSLWGTRDSVLYEKYYISVGATEKTIFSSASDWQQTQIVKEIDSLVIRRNDVHTWVWHEFDNPYLWDGVSNIVIQVAYQNSTAVTTGMQTAYTTQANTTLHKNDNSAFSPSLLGFTGSGNKGSNRPNILFEGTPFGCNGPISQIAVNLLNVPEHDATVYWPAGYDTLSYNTCINVQPMVTVRNLGSAVMNGYDLHYWIDEDTVGGITQRTDVIAGGNFITVPLFSLPLEPGRHTIRVVISSTDDSLAANDTAMGMITVRFCGGTYTIAADSTGEFISFNAAIDTLNIVGLEGSLIFNVYPGVYNEQVRLGNVPGMTENISIFFIGMGTEENEVRLVGNTSANDNYVFKLDSISNVTIQGIRMEARPELASVKAANVMVINNSRNIYIDNNRFRVKGTIIDANASCLVLGDSVQGLTMTNNRLDSGYYAIRGMGSGYESIYISGNTFTDFQYRGLDMSDVKTIHVLGNTMHAGTSADGKPLIGVYLTHVDSTLSIQNNKIYLIDDHTGAKRGIHLENVYGSEMEPAYIVNNMISVYGTGAAGLTPKNPAGIYIDNNCSYINIFYNTVRAYAGTTQNDTRAFFAGASNSNLQVMNNIFSNFSQSYAYYIGGANAILNSDYNAYYNNGNNKLAYWGTDRATLAALQTANGMDENSVNDMPFFVANDDLHVLMTNFCAKAQFNPDVMYDIDGNPRPPIPAPTIGAHELERFTRNMTVVQISEPRIPLNLNNPYNIEGDSILVIASFYNNGSSIENNVTWYAYIDGYETSMSSAVRNLGTFNPAQMKTDSVWIPTILGVIDTQIVRVVITSDGDEDLTDNELTTPVYLAPAFNLEAVKIQTANTGCTAANTTVSITVKNVGFKPIPANSSIQIGYHTQAYYPSFIASNPDSNKLYIATMPDTVKETQTFETALPKSQTRVFNFTTPANLYPTDTSLNIKVRINGWMTFQYDILNDNDSTGPAASASPVVDAYYTPNPPVGYDTVIAYGSWGAVRASQENQRPIRWYRDSTATPFYTTTGNNAYANSCLWNTTPQYFHDSTYYLMCYSDKNCPSHFSAVHVTVASMYANDMSVEEVLAPVGNRVYMENDTVRVRIANYGTQSQTNIPVTYALRKGSNQAAVQTVTETCTATIGPGQTHIFTFDSLVQFTSATAGGKYYLRVWTDLANDQSRRNDTIRTKNILRPSNVNDVQLDYSFDAKAETTYPTRTNTSSDEIDIVRFTFNEIDVDLPGLGRSYTNFGVFANPEIPVLHTMRGMTDSVFIQLTKPSDPNAVERGKIAVYIDFNRNGSFLDSGECVIPNTNLWIDSLFAGEITIPMSASYGYMKMRVSASRNDKNPLSTITGDEGHMLDFLLFIDAERPSTDLSLMQIVSPRDYLVTDAAPRTISFRMANRGSTPITQAEIYYSFTPDTVENTVTGSITWTGNLQPGRSTVVTLPAHAFPLGTTVLTLWHQLEGDAVPSNNTLVYEYHRFHTVYLSLDDSFDEEIQYWYAPTGYTNYTRNYWQCGTPTKNRINQPYSGPNAWVTDLSANVTSGRRGNVSYLYSPIINIAQIKPDTLSFRMIKNLTGGSYVKIEYRNYEGKWVNMASDTCDPPSWYNNTEDKRFDGTSNTYGYYYIPTSLISGNFQEKWQFRIAYRTPQGSNDNASYGEGCAIDNFYIGRARRRWDIGVTAITKPTAPKYGQTIYPEVLVKNYGTDTIDHIHLGYIHYGTYLAKETVFENCRLAPDAVDTFLFDSPFIITSDYPETFNITAFSIYTADIYKDNDTVTKQFQMTQLDNDISADAFITPLDRVIAGDSIIVTMRIRNFGLNPISSANLTYVVSGREPVTESVNFIDALGYPLQSMEYFNYTFQRKFRASMGMMMITGITKCDSNEYIYNDTISKRFTGISSIMDLAAAAVIVDTTSSYTDVKVALVIDNRGARGANDFEVGFWVDDDTANIHREVYHTHHPLPALSRGYHLFETTLPPRATPYDHITGFVNIVDDNDLSNDTTTEFMSQFIDVEALGILVEENSAAECRVFIKVRNKGNMALVGHTIHFNVNVNGNDLSFDLVRRLDPMQVVTIQLDRTIPKSPTRHYTGSASFDLSVDSDPTNNQTSLVSVVNYVEGVPTVNDMSQLVLEQNYPNPYAHQTTVPFTLPRASTVRFFVMDATGHLVNDFTLFGVAGPNSVVLDMDAYPAGIYYYGIEVDGLRQMRKMILR